MYWNGGNSLKVDKKSFVYIAIHFLSSTGCEILTFPTFTWPPPDRWLSLSKAWLDRRPTDLNLRLTLRLRLFYDKWQSCPFSRSACMHSSSSCSSLPSLSWQLFTTSETGETFSILKTLFKTLCSWSWLGCLGQALCSRPHSSWGNSANSIIHMHFILIDLIRYLWRGLQTLLAAAAQLTAAVKLSLQSFVITIIALLFSAQAAWFSVHLIMIGRS